MTLHRTHKKNKGCQSQSQPSRNVLALNVHDDVSFVPQLTQPWIHECSPVSASLFVGRNPSQETMTLQFNRNPQVQIQQKKATKAKHERGYLVI